MMLRQEKKILREVSLYEPIGTDQEGNHISLLDIISTDEAAAGGSVSSQILSQSS